MAWIIRLPNGTTVNSDDFTLENLGDIEDATGEPWSLQNPLRTVQSARAFLTIAYRNNGLAVADVDALTLGRLKSMFQFEEDKPFPGGDGDDAAPLAPSSSGSSPGASEGSTGSRRKRASSA